ncbi:MAG: PEP-CTERM sorting domain-containing protein [Alphaproteobacteria bacterium]
MPGAAVALPTVWAVDDHPNGALNNGPGQSYMLRLGTNATHPNTFTVESAGTGAVLSFDPAVNANLMTMTGIIQHNRDSSGPISGGFYNIAATFQSVQLTDPDATPWFDPNPSNALYDGIFDDLLANSDDTPLNSPSFSTLFDRIYFQLVDLTLAFDHGTDTYTGPLVWDEFPNNGVNGKQFFCQKDHRATTGIFTCAGWVEEAPDSGRERTSDYLFAAHPIPEPASLALFGFGLAGFAFLGRRRKAGNPEVKTRKG